MVFLAIIGMLLAGFFGYHAKLCITNTTTNETFKWQDYIEWQRKLREAKVSAEALKQSIDGIRSEKQPSSSKWRAFFRKSPLEDVVVVKNNVYDKGFFHNIQEVISPFSASLLLRPKNSIAWRKLMPEENGKAVALPEEFAPLISAHLPKTHELVIRDK
ncbi:hypothetical protein V8G54_032562 [Vigna mungo]|uniref:Protein S-acyltransferase n=1 Tax=Vigna mungo TaxID=3915 RepID=A0AAQ3MLC2_VIGMU